MHGLTCTHLGWPTAQGRGCLSIRGGRTADGPGTPTLGKQEGQSREPYWDGETSLSPARRGAPRAQTRSQTMREGRREEGPRADSSQVNIWDPKQEPRAPRIWTQSKQDVQVPRRLPSTQAWLGGQLPQTETVTPGGAWGHVGPLWISAVRVH